MDIGYLWDEDKEARVRAEHGVELDEAIEAIADPNHSYHNDPQGNWGRFLIVGKTRTGRLLQVIISDEELPIIRIITAYDAEKRWRQDYEQG